MMLLITGCGHSGTKFVAELFQIKHEPRLSDYQVFVPAWHNKNISRNYVRENFTGEERESNSFLIPHIEAILEFFPEANIFHLVRDPRKVVRSFMSNGLYSNDGIDYHNVKLDVPNFENLSQFEKCCWYWRVVNERLRSFKFPLIRLEDLKGKPINAKPHSFPSWEEWTDEQKRQFNEILGDILPYYGYEKIKI